MKSFLEQTAQLAPTLHRNERLNPVLWDGDRLRPDVRVRLLNFAEAWRRYARIPEEQVLDVLFVGGNASLFYNEASDIDVHLLVHRDRLGLGPVVDDFLKDRKALWTSEHDVRVHGYPLEPYAQDVSETPPRGQGVYSLTRDEWVHRPTQTAYDPATDRGLSRKAESWRRSIDKAIGEGADTDRMERLKTKLADMRKQGIARGGELGRDNLVFKSLRLSGHLDRMNRYIHDRETADLSLA